MKNGDLLALHLFDKRNIFALSAVHSNGNFEFVWRSEDESVTKPTMINKCNKFTGAVDYCDCSLATYSVSVKQKIGCKRL